MNQTDRRKYLIKALLSEQQRYKGVEQCENGSINICIDDDIAVVITKLREVM